MARAGKFRTVAANIGRVQASTMKSIPTRRAKAYEEQCWVQSRTIGSTHCCSGSSTWPWMCHLIEHRLVLIRKIAAFENVRCATQFIFPQSSTDSNRDHHQPHDHIGHERLETRIRRLSTTRSRTITYRLIEIGELLTEVTNPVEMSQKDQNGHRQTENSKRLKYASNRGGGEIGVDPL